eukprot:764074-Hanusia_phi.AAC.1
MDVEFNILFIGKVIPIQLIILGKQPLSSTRNQAFVGDTTHSEAGWLVCPERIGLFLSEASVGLEEDEETRMADEAASSARGEHGWLYGSDGDAEEVVAGVGWMVRQGVKG